MKRRDRKERELDTIKEQIRINKETEVRFEFNYEKKFQGYQDWKKENKIEGIKY